MCDICIHNWGLGIYKAWFLNRNSNSYCSLASQGITKLNPKCMWGYIFVLQFQCKTQTSHLNLDFIRDNVLFVFPRLCGSWWLCVSLDHILVLLACAEGTVLRNMRKSHIVISLNILSNVPRNSMILASNRLAIAMNNSTISPPGSVGQSYKVRLTDWFPRFQSGPEAQTFITWLFTKEPPSRSFRKYT